MSVHPEVPVKVTAFVDAAVAPLVAALDAVDEGLLTLDSCQGSGTEWARVSFTHHGTVDDLVGVTRHVAELLDSRLVADALVRLEWMPGAEQPIAELLVQRECVNTVVDALASQRP